MHTFIKLVWAVILIAPAAFSQNGPVPRVVVQHFQQQFTNASQVQWVALKDDRYEAAFNQQGTVKKVTFSPNGQWVTIENSVNARELPLAVSRTLTSEFGGYEVLNAVRVETFGQRTGFRIRIKKKNDSWEVEIDTGGRVRRRVEVYERRDGDCCREHQHQPKNKRHCRHDHNKDDDDEEDDD